MLKVLLVDDEPSVLEGLKIMIDWEKHGFSICGEACDGEDALEIIKLCNPHLVITDINMPIFNGLQLIKRAVEMPDIRAKFIILSGYDDFEYARTAMKYGVSNYILKPIDSDNVNEILIKMKSEINKETQEKHKMDEQIAFIANNTLKRIVKGENKEKLMKRAKFLLEIDDEDEIYCILFEADKCYEFDGDLKQKETNINIESIKNNIFRFLHSQYPLYVFEDGEDRIGLIIKGTYIKNNIKKYLKELVEDFSEQCSQSISCFASDKNKGIGSIKKGYMQALNAKKLKFYKTNGNINFYSDLNEISNEFGKADYRIEISYEDIEENNTQAIEKAIKEYFADVTRYQPTQELVLANLKNETLELIIFIEKIYENSDDFTKTLFIFNPDINKLNTYELEEYILKQFFLTARYIQQLNKIHNGDPIYEIKRYILRNYAKELTIQKIAQRFNINSTYLGQLFKKNLGVKLNDYLNQIRIEEAKKLIRKTDLKISAIASLVGYNDHNYFINKFKTIAKCLPSDYKKENEH